MFFQTMRFDRCMAISVSDGANLMPLQLMFFDFEARTQISKAKLIRDFRSHAAKYPQCRIFSTLWQQERFVFVGSIDLVKAMQQQEVLMLAPMYPQLGLYLQ
jgi:hypothetical protein